MQFDIVFITTALLASASLAMSATVTLFSGPNYTGAPATPVSPMSSTSLLPAEVTKIASLAPNFCLMVPLDVRLRLRETIGVVLWSSRFLAVETALGSINL
ncbi:hypothetical protein CPB84DRAFT_291974 [Gymnopilus junonius]|uniref:Secreted protein n=1 Tax=Gymnopilus junonius TaxID=109634 RepID=A0A9P5NEZ5_GYMJU|nr:hypothetical protein CPB84DRAFT_291974 [Gymnopilus junonius]